MRTTLEIDDAVLAAARALAAQERMSLGAAVSELALRGLRPTTTLESAEGFPVLVPTDPGRVITDELVSRYRDDDD